MRGNYQRPSDLLKRQKESGLSYWDLIGRPLYGNPIQETPGFTIAENYPGYEGGKDDYKLTPSQKKTIAQMYKRLRAAGFDDNSIAGIIGNSIQESGINPNLSSTNKMYHGLFQNSSKLRDKIAALYGDHSMNNQLQYVIDWTNKDKRIMGKAYAPYMATGAGKYKKTGYKTAEEAAEAFMKLYERPVILDKKGNVIGYQEHGKRKAYGKQMGTYLRTTYPQKGNPTTFMQTEPEEVALPMPVTPTPQYTYDTPAQQVVPQVQPQVNMPVENNQYEQFMIEKQAQQDAFNLAMNNVYSKLPNPVDRLGQFMQFNRGKSLNPVIYY